ncbi:conserved hypothetical protein [Methanocaldococcus infernus ME]|uniref:DUF2111 domain-containing protein n=1 Tax=Methanocaldococcus infernus (strain DSM 11812 / JCM 15783 / ME) TaxID=573063 RepID=D5VQM8_METIM|nr:DUF2111 domain-containing protein [Methanocaldococcus infernus]ADG12881.1 conserved hypothetical protein [Methanocaldococcus infernus ME]
MIKLSEDADAKEIKDLALAIHHLVNKLPVAMRSKKKPGVRVEKGKIVDENYEGYVLKLAIKTGKTIKATPIAGPYKGVPVIVVPIVKDGEVLGSIGVVDITAGIFEEILAISRRPELAKFLPEEAFPR